MFSFFHIPATERRPMLTRLLIVWGVALVIALMQWQAFEDRGHQLDMALVYSYAISTSIWLLSDPCRFWVQGQLKKAWAHSAFLMLACVLGYSLGTWIGDSYAGWSTWDLLNRRPSKFFNILLGSAALSLAFVAYFTQRSRAERVARAHTEAQLRLLQSQLEPHMLFNTLANLHALMAHDTARAQAMLGRLIDFLRATLQASRQSQHSLAQEFAYLNDYLQLMQVRMGERLRFTLDLAPELADTPVPSLILQALVENSIRHGVEPCVQGGSVHISASRQGEQLHLFVQDTGCGFMPSIQTQSSEIQPHHTAFGLSHVRQRLMALYGSHAQLHIASDESSTCGANLGGTCVHLILPLRANAEAIF